jgi:hypothetical protein
VATLSFAEIGHNLPKFVADSSLIHRRFIAVCFHIR